NDGDQSDEKGVLHKARPLFPAIVIFKFELLAHTALQSDRLGDAESRSTPAAGPMTCSGPENAEGAGRVDPLLLAHQSGNYLTAEPTWLNLSEALRPRMVTATMHTTAISATRRAYSTRLAPRSSFTKRARIYGAQNCCQ